MARRRRDEPRPPSVPPPRHGTRRTIARARPEVPDELEAVPAAASAAELSKQYDHVRRDLIRIAVFAVVVFGLIFASRFIMPFA